MTRWGVLTLALLGLSSLAQTARVALRWKPVTGASAYELQIAKDSSFADVVLQTRTTTPGYRWDQLPETTHWWRVRAVDAEGRVGEWSAPRTVAIDSVVPEVLRPAEGWVSSCGASVEVELAASNLVKEYQLEVASSAGFSGARELRQATPVFALGPLSAGAWFVRARAVDVKGTVVGPGPARAFLLRVPSPKLKPVPEAVLGAGQLSLTWAAAACAASYVVELSVVDDSAGREVNSLAAAAPMVAFKSNVAGDYRWRVAGVDEHGQPGEWSAEGLFRVKLPAPSALKSNGLELSWASVPTATAYTVEVARQGSTDAPLRETLAGTAWRPALAPGRYTWRVQARDAKNHLSAFSEVRVVERAEPAALPAPTLTATDEVVASGGEVGLSWAAVTGATSYELEVDGQARRVASTAQRVSALSDGAHSFRVRALAPGERGSAFSDSVEVVWGTPPTVDAQVAVVGDEVQVRLRDARGRVVEGAPPALAVTHGQLTAVVPRDGQWVSRWQSAADDAVLRIDERGFHAERAIHRGVPPAFWAAASVGGVFNGGAVASPGGALAVGYRLPLFSRRLGVELRGGVAFASASLLVGSEPVRGSAWLVPMSVLVGWHQPVGAYVVRGGVGPSGQVIAVTVDQQRQTSVVPGFELAASVERAVGPGRLMLEAGFVWARLDTGLARLIAGGVGLRLGYVVDFELGAAAPARER